MPTMVTFQAGRVALLSILAGLATACSREQQDWRSAEGADSTEAWQRFVEQHPDSELVREANTRIAQLEVQREFQHADLQGTVDAYRDFLAHHPSGKWAEHARIRIEAFSLGSAPRTGPPTPEEAAAFSGSGVRALHLATAAIPPAPGASTAADGAQAGPAEAIQPAGLTFDAGQPKTAAGADSADGTSRAVPGEAAHAPRDDEVVKPASSNETTGNSGYGVQLGAFGSEASADREWRRLRGRFGTALGNLSARIVVAESDSGQLYRLQAPAAGEAQARAICDSLREQEQACMPVLPR
jgi:cell division septation protein DedD